jgi:transcriptional regulator with XRE-family HTH domain
VRTQRGLTLEQLAEGARISRSFLWEVEQGRSDISGTKLVRLANVLGASLDYLLRGTSVAETPRPPTVDIPAELSEVAEELGLSHRETVALLNVNQSIVARRGQKSRAPRTQEEWRRLYDAVKPFLEERA